MTLGQHIRVIASVIVMSCIIGYVFTTLEIEKEQQQENNAFYIDYIKAAQLPSADEYYIGEVIRQLF